MNITQNTKRLIFFIGLGGLLILAGCSGNNNDAQGTSTIQGNVMQVLTAMEEESMEMLGALAKNSHILYPNQRAGEPSQTCQSTTRYDVMWLGIQRPLATPS